MAKPITDITTPDVGHEPHPKGLYVLFGAEAWERFSYYGMRALLVLYMVNHLKFPREYALEIYGLYTGLVVGRVGVVAPVTGVIAATLPVVVGLVAQGWPGNEVVAGIVLALAAVVLVSRSTPADGGPGSNMH